MTTPPTPEYNEISVLPEYPYGYNDRREWDCYSIVSALVFIGIDEEEDYFVSVFNPFLSRESTSNYKVRVLPYNSIYGLVTRPVDDISISLAINLFYLWLEDNMNFIYDTHFNDERDPFPCPPDVSLLSS